MGRKSQEKGKAGERVAHYLLNTLGINNIRPIATPFVIIDEVWVPKKTKGGRIIRNKKGQPIMEKYLKIEYAEEVAGDFEGQMDDGRRVLIEVKTRDDKLSWGDIKPHQRVALNDCDACNGVSLVVWVHRWGAAALRWPMEGFANRKPIKPEHIPLHEWDGQN